MTNAEWQRERREGWYPYDSVEGVVDADEDDDRDVGVIGENGEPVPTMELDWVRFGCPW